MRQLLLGMILGFVLGSTSLYAWDWQQDQMRRDLDAMAQAAQTQQKLLLQQQQQQALDRMYGRNPC